MSVLPNLVYIGPDKAASTWFFQLFRAHPEIYVTPAKDVYFFDRYFDKGLEWYSQQFEGGQGFPVISEISHDYLISSVAALRMRRVLPDVKLMVCLREPTDRAFSGYLHLVKSGHFSGSFEEAIDAHPGLVDRSLYGRWINEYLQHFPRSQLCAVVFDDLKSDPQECVNDLCRQIGVSQFELPEQLYQNELPAGRSRCAALTRVLKRGASFARDMGLPGLVGRVKSSRITQRLLYIPYRQAERPQPPLEVVERLTEVFRADIAQVDELLGTNLGQRWEYDTGLHDQGLSATDEPKQRQPLTAAV